jgi:hypothetical protein
VLPLWQQYEKDMEVYNMNLVKGLNEMLIIPKME